MLRKILLSLAVASIVAILVAAAFVVSRQNLVFDAPYPEITASTDSAIVARGRYIVCDVAICASCHGDIARREEYMAGEETALSGGFAWDIPPGRFHAPNITPDDETGIGKVSDQAIARALRYGVGHDGRALLPFMETEGLSDEDLTAVVSYLRSLPSVENPVPAHRYTMLGKIVKATLLAKPVGPKEKPPEVSPRGATIENGRYLTESVALCGECHTQRSQASGQFTGPRHGGAIGMSEPDDPEHLWSPPNITSDPETGRLGSMSEDVFVARFRTGRALERSPMPWQGYSRMAEEDLRAIHRYLASLPPVKRDVGPPLVEVKK